MELGFIEDVVVKWADWKVQGWYIKLNYIETTPLKNHLVDNTTCGNQDTNAWNNKYINAWSIKSEMLEDETQKNDSLEESTSLPFSSYTEWNLQQETNNKLTSISKESHIEKKQKIPSIEEIRNKYPKKMIMEYFHKIMSQTKFADKTDINSFQEYHDHIVDKFCIAYWWRKENVWNYKDYVYYVIEEFRVHYALEEDEIKNFKWRLSTWIKNSIKYTLPRYNREHPGDAIVLNV